MSTVHPLERWFPPSGHLTTSYQSQADTVPPCRPTSLDTTFTVKQKSGHAEVVKAHVRGPSSPR